MIWERRCSIRSGSERGEGGIREGSKKGEVGRLEGLTRHPEEGLRDDDEEELTEEEERPRV